MNLVFYGIGLVAAVVLLSLLIFDFDTLKPYFEVKFYVVFFSLVIASSTCNYFPFRVPPNLYMALSMLLYLTTFLILPPLAAALVPVIASLIFELIVVKRGPAYAARTSGMYAICTILARLTYESLGPKSPSGDVSLDMILPLLVAFLVFRSVNELGIGLTQYMQGYGLSTFWGHILQVTSIYLLLLPGALVLALLVSNIGPVAFAVSCGLVTITGFILNRATTAREKEATQLVLVSELNQRLARQNERQLELGNRINITLDSFLNMVRDYAGTSHEQEAAVVEITSTIEELSRTASQIAGAADNVAVAAERAIEAAVSGQGAVNATIESINEVSAKVREIADKISDLNSKSERIGEIVTVINSIAGEIRLLALNATIEASGAGQFGRRFSIVANEVNQLADRSREALQQIKQIIGEIQMATVSSRRVTEEGLQRMEHGVETVSRSERANQEIIEVVQKTAQAAAAISLATQQQRSASEQVVTSIHDVAVMIGQNAEKVASVSVASLDLKHIASELTEED
jgi:methyl-accepting chemotaxis protein